MKTKLGLEELNSIYYANGKLFVVFTARQCD